MSLKQDRQGVRKATDLEQKYNFGKSFAEVMGLAKGARQTADDAKETVAKLDEKLTSEEIFNRLTENGTLQGLYRGDDGEIYMNASYIKAGELLADLIKGGVLSSKDGTIEIDLDGNTVPVFNTGISTNGLQIRSDKADVSNLFTVSAFTNSYGYEVANVQLNSGTSKEQLMRITELFNSDGTSVGVIMGLDSQDKAKTVGFRASNADAAMYLYNGKEVHVCDIATATGGGLMRVTTTDGIYRAVLQAFNEGEGVYGAGLFLRQSGANEGSFLVGSDGNTYLNVDKINNRDVSNGVATLDENGKVTADQASSSVVLITDTEYYTLSASDMGKMLIGQLAAGGEGYCEMLIPADPDLTIPIGSEVEISKWNGGLTVYVVCEDGVSIRTRDTNTLSGFDIDGKYGVVSLKRISATKWYATGDIA